MGQNRIIAGDPRIAVMLEQILDAKCTPEEACRECPELLGPVRAELHQLRLLQDELTAIFPQRSGSTCASDAVTRNAAKTLPDMPGYDQLELIDSGGMGVVYKARQVALNRVVAIKVLVARGDTGTRNLERFKREAAAVAAVRHPNIVQVYDAGEHDGFPFFAMEYVEGGNLAQALGGMPQAAGKAAEMLATLARAVHAAHVSGTMHRDLKPANILCTSDGTLKIADFGLARSLEENGRTHLTLEGTPVGTPSYMSPEQALGSTELGTAVDTYALGAILYEMLTGRPPFRGESFVETQRQVISDDPVPPTRLNPRTPQDLETICLKCLEKAPQHRYPAALALAEDIDRFLRGQPIAARRAGAIERTWKWARRRPTAAALSAALTLAVLLSAVLLLGSVRAGQRRAAMTSAVESDLKKLAELRQTFHWDESQAVLAHARGLLASEGGSAPAEVRAALDRAAADLELARQLDSMRDHRASDRDYEKTLGIAGVPLGDSTESVAQRVRTSEMAEAIVAALDDWAAVTDNEQRRAWCLNVSRMADTDPSGWRGRVRDPAIWLDRTALAATLRAAPIGELPTTLLVAVSERLIILWGVDDAIEFLKRADREHIGDFGVNYRLGRAFMDKHNPAEAIGYYRTALAIKPRAMVSNDLGFALKAAGRIDEAIPAYEQAIRLDAQCAPAHLNLGVVLRSKGELDRAIESYRRAISADPKFAVAHNNLANALKAKGDLPGAIEHFEEAARLAPTLPDPHYNLGLLYGDNERVDDAIAQYEEAIRIAPNYYKAHNNLGNLFASRKLWDQAVAHCRRAVELAPEDAQSRTSLGKALQSQGTNLDEALVQLREAVRLKPEEANKHAALGEALLAQGKLDEAENSLRRALDLLPESDPGRADLQQKLLDCQTRRAGEKKE